MSINPKGVCRRFTLFFACSKFWVYIVKIYEVSIYARSYPHVAKKMKHSVQKKHKIGKNTYRIGKNASSEKLGKMIQNALKLQKNVWKENGKEKLTMGAHIYRKRVKRCDVWKRKGFKTRVYTRAFSAIQCFWRETLHFTETFHFKRWVETKRLGEKVRWLGFEFLTMFGALIGF